MRVLDHLVSDVIDRFSHENILQTSGSFVSKPAVLFFYQASKENQCSPFTCSGLDCGVIIKVDTNIEAFSQFFSSTCKENNAYPLCIPGEIQDQAKNHSQSILCKNKICHVFRSEKT